MPLYILLDYESYADLKKLIFHKNSIKSLSQPQMQLQIQSDQLACTKQTLSLCINVFKHA